MLWLPLLPTFAFLVRPPLSDESVTATQLVVYLCVSAHSRVAGELRRGVR